MKNNTQSAFSQDSTVFKVIISISGFWMVLLLAYFIDNFLFNAAGVNALRAANSKLFLGMVLLLSLGMGPIILLLMKKRNRAFEEKILDKIEATFSGSNPEEISSISDVALLEAENYAKADPAFDELYQRFNYYLSQVSKKFVEYRHQTIDIYSPGYLSMATAIYVPAVMLLSMLTQFIFYHFYFPNSLGLSFTRALKMGQSNNPMVFYLMTGLFIVALGKILLVISSFVRKNFFGYVEKLSEKITNKANPEPLEKQLQLFFDTPWQVTSSLDNSLAMRIMITLIPLPLFVGIVVPEKGSILFALIVLSISGITYWFGRRRNPSFQVSKNGLVQLIEHAGIKSFSLLDCAWIWVQYQPLNLKGSGSSSISAFASKLVVDNLKRMQEYPVLRPHQMHFGLKSGQTYSVSLREVCNEEGESCDSHAVEFYFAFLLKQLGFSFDLQETNEQAGDWRATIRG